MKIVNVVEFPAENRYYAIDGLFEKKNHLED